MDIRECLPKSSVLIRTCVLGGKVFEIYNSQRSLCAVVGDRMYSKSNEKYLANMLRRDMKERVIDDFCAQIRHNPKMNLKISFE